MRRILVIDDDVPIGDMLEELLVRENYQVSRAYSGTEALLALSGAKLDLIVLDLMLPGLPGEEVLAKIDGIPVIVLSARADVESSAQTVKVGIRIPKFAARAPTMPATRIPAKVAQFRPSGPGVISAMATISETSVEVIYPCPTISPLISGIIDRPPKLVKPIWQKLQKSCIIVIMALAPYG